jgi:hypothetical protein
MESHVLDVGPHVHEWIDIDGSVVVGVYQECEICKTRRFYSSTSAVPARQDWLDGADWEKEVGSPRIRLTDDAGKDIPFEVDEAPSDSAVRRMTKPELAEYGATLGLFLTEGDMTHDEMVDEILSHRAAAAP